jgi:two-component system, OmpR family, sensor kinase
MSPLRLTGLHTCVLLLFTCAVCVVALVVHDRMLQNSRDAELGIYAQAADPNGSVVARWEVVGATSPQGAAALWVSVLAAGALALPLAVVAGRLMTRAALAPLDGFIRTIRAIGDADDLGGRIRPLPRPTYPAMVRLADEFNRMLARLQGSAQRVDEVLDAQRRFVADASHELRTPLTSLRGNIHLLRDDAAADAPAEHLAILDEMEAEAARMTRLVGDLLLLAEADAGSHLVLAPVDMASIVRHASRTARRLRHDVAVHVYSAPGGLWVCGDGDRLTQVVLILLDNALKFSPSGGTVDLRVEGAAWAAFGSGVLMRVTDSGPGVPPEERELIFERFYRSDRGRAAEGAGLGLSIARWIVQEHRGTLELESNGNGATFSVWLPSTSPPET